MVWRSAGEARFLAKEARFLGGIGRFVVESSLGGQFLAWEIDFSLHDLASHLNLRLWPSHRVMLSPSAYARLTLHR